MEAIVERMRIIKLLCPSISSKTVQITAWEDQKLDLGSIARVFGLDPNTLKLNGHFISRGADLIASSVTWKSLIGFFSARGLSTGAADSDALVIHGKLSKIGSKRFHDPVGNEIPSTNAQGYIRDNKKPHIEYGGMLNNNKIKEPNSDAAGGKCNGPNGLNLKRKLCLEDAVLGKRSRSDECASSYEERRLSCSFMGTNMKRMRDEEIFAATPLKKTRYQNQDMTQVR